MFLRMALASGFLLTSLSFMLSGCGGNGGSAPPETAQGVQGTNLPYFEALDETGRQRKAGDFRGKLLVLYFYPKDGTPGCTKEACAFRDAWDEIQAAGATVVGISMDSVESHKKFKDEHQLPFTLLTDPEGRIASALGVEKNDKGLLKRTTFIVGRDNIVKKVFRDVDPAVHVKEVLQVIEGLKASK